MNSVHSNPRSSRFDARRAFNLRIAKLHSMNEHEIGRPTHSRRLSNIIQGQLNVRVDPLYDNWQVPVNTAVVAETLFAIPLGNPYTPPTGTAFNKTLYHTNSVQANSLDAPKKMLVKNISIVNRCDMAPNDVNALVGQYLVTFQTLGKNYWQGHAKKLPGGAGAFVSGVQGAGQTGNSTFSTANGWPSAQNNAPITEDTPDIPGYAPPPPITGVLLETNQPYNVFVDPTLTKGTVYTTANSTTTLAGVPSIGVYAWCYLEGIKLVAIV